MLIRALMCEKELDGLFSALERRDLKEEKKTPPTKTRVSINPEEPGKIKDKIQGKAVVFLVSRQDLDPFLSQKDLFCDLKEKSRDRNLAYYAVRAKRPHFPLLRGKYSKAKPDQVFRSITDLLHNKKMVAHLKTYGRSGWCMVLRGRPGDG